MSLKYESCMSKTTTAKKLVQKTGISVWEAERQLNADIFLDEYPRWEPHRSHCPFLLHCMVAHAAAMGQKKQDQAIHQGHQQSLPRQDLSVESSAIELFGPKSTREEIRGVYNEVY